MERVYRTRLAQRNGFAVGAKEQARKTKCPEQTQTNPRQAKGKILIAAIDRLMGRCWLPPIRQARPGRASEIESEHVDFDPLRSTYLCNYLRARGLGREWDISGIAYNHRIR